MIFILVPIDKNASDLRSDLCYGLLKIERSLDAKNRRIVRLNDGIFKLWDHM